MGAIQLPRHSPSLEKTAKIAIPDLVDRLSSRPLTQPALTALRHIDPGLSETVQQLIEKLSSDDEDSQLRSTLVLALLKEESTPALTSLQTNRRRRRRNNGWLGRVLALEDRSGTLFTSTGASGVD